MDSENLTREIVIEMASLGKSMAGLCLSGIDLSRTNLAGANFQQSDLRLSLIHI